MSQPEVIDAAGRARAGVPGARRDRPAPRGRARARLRRARVGAGRPAGLRDRAHGAGHDRARAARATTPRRARSSSSCSGRRSAGPRPRAASSGTRPTRSCRRSPARRPSASPCRRASTWRSRRRSTSTALPDGEVPLAFNFNGTVHYRGDDGRLQMSLVPWSCSAEFRLPVSTWRDLIEHYYPRTGWIALREETLAALQREKAQARAADARRLRGRAARGGAVSVDELVDSLLYEGYALYPYTPGATKNATPTPFGIVYPPAYARGARHDPRPPRAPVRGRGRRRDHRRGALPAAERRAPRGRAAADRGRGRVQLRRRLGTNRP